MIAEGNKVVAMVTEMVTGGNRFMILFYWIFF
jgi:hypothetical protein